jgi:photosystem I subunit 2
VCRAAAGDKPVPVKAAGDKPAPAKAAAKKPAAKKKKEPEPWAGPPTLDPNTPSPIFGGSTGGLLRKAQVEEFYVLTWESKKEQIFEMPTGGAAIMRQGPNLLKLARKEQCLALLTQLRTKFKCDGCVYRVFPSGEVQYLHPADGVYPEKVNPGRVQVNGNQRNIGSNGQPIAVKFKEDSVNPNTGKTETFWDGSSTDRGGSRFVTSGKD